MFGSIYYFSDSTKLTNKAAEHSTSYYLSFVASSFVIVSVFFLVTFFVFSDIVPSCVSACSQCPECACPSLPPPAPRPEFPDRSACPECPAVGCFCPTMCHNAAPAELKSDRRRNKRLPVGKLSSLSRSLSLARSMTLSRFDRYTAAFPMHLNARVATRAAANNYVVCQPRRAYARGRPGHCVIKVTGSDVAVPSRTAVSRAVKKFEGEMRT